MFKDFLEANKPTIIVFAIMTVLSLAVGIALTGDLAEAGRHRR